MERLGQWLSRLLTGLERPTRRVAIVFTVTGLAVCWGIALRSNPVTAVSRHWFYVPVVFAAVRFGVPGALTAGVAAGLLGGPLAGGLSTLTVDPAVWATRAAFFIGIGLVVGALVEMVRRGLRAEIVLAQREAELADQQATFIQTISHEFRTPLTILRGSVLMFDRQRQGIDARLHPLLDGMVRAERRLDEMVSVVLATAEAVDASRRLETEPVRVGQLTADVVGSLEHRDAAHRVRLEVHGSGMVVTVRGYLRLILHTVIDNALRFSPPGSPVVVRADTAPGCVSIRVRDHGEGMDAKLLRAAFSPFTQGDGSAHREHGGLGLGLFAARGLAERLGGTVTAETMDPGLTVTITFPQRRETDRPPAAGRAGSWTPPAGPRVGHLQL